MLVTIRKCVAIVLLASFCATGLSSRAVADDAPKTKLKLKSKSKADGSNSSDPPLRVWRRTRSMEKLERAILTGVKLDDAQRTTVKKAFTKLYKVMRDNPRRASFYPQAYEAYSGEKLKSRKDDLKRANKAGDRKLAKEIEADIKKHTVGSETNLTPVPEDIIPELAKVMRGDQISAYQKITARWVTLRPRGPMDGPFRMILRAIKDPELKLSAEQNEASYNLLGEIQMQVRKNHDPDNVAKLSVLARDKVMKLLKGDQRSHFNSTLLLLAAERKAIRNYAKKWFGSRGRVMPKHLNQPIPWEK